MGGVGGRRTLLRDAAPGLAVALVVAAFGLVLGRVWAEVAPRVGVIKVEQGLVYADAEPEQAVASDGAFALLGLVAGLVFAVVAWRVLRRWRGVSVLIGLTVGSLAGAVLAWRVGYQLGQTEFQHAVAAAAVGQRLDAPLGLRITDLDAHAFWPPQPTGVAAVQALAAAFVYTALAGFSADDTLRGHSRDSPEPNAGNPYPGGPYPGGSYPGDPYAGGSYPGGSYPGGLGPGGGGLGSDAPAPGQ